MKLPSRDDTIEAYKFGRDVLGPPLITFAHLLLLEAKRRKIQKLAFLARDGYVLMQITQRLLLGASTDAPNLSYAYLSRRALCSANSSVINKAIVQEILFMPVTGSPINRFLASFDISPSVATPHLNRLGIDTDDNSREDLETLINDVEFSAVFAEESGRRKNLVSQYLEQESITQSTTALVDIGWRGSISTYLANAFGEETVPLTFLLGFWSDGVLENLGNENRKLGLLCDYRRGRNIFESSAWHVASLLEAICRGPHGTVTGFTRDSSGRVVPVFAGPSESLSAETRSESLRLEVQRGITDRAEHYRRTHDLDFLDEQKARRESQRALLRLGFFPTREEIKIAQRLVQTEASSEQWSATLIPEVTCSPLSAPRKWLEGLKSPWRAGYVAASGGGTFSLAFLLFETMVSFCPTCKKTVRRIALTLASGTSAPLPRRKPKL